MKIRNTICASLAVLIMGAGSVGAMTQEEYMREYDKCMALKLAIENHAKYYRTLQTDLKAALKSGNKVSIKAAQERLKASNTTYTDNTSEFSRVYKNNCENHVKGSISRGGRFNPSAHGVRVM